MSSAHFAMRLNNFLQGRYGANATKQYRYEETGSGPENHQIWEGTYYINDMRYGAGQGTNKKNAKESAAKRTIALLEQEGNRVP